MIEKLNQIKKLEKRIALRVRNDLKDRNGIKILCDFILEQRTDSFILKESLLLSTNKFDSNGSL
jgi:hypothetical protein